MSTDDAYPAPALVTREWTYIIHLRGELGGRWLPDPLPDTVENVENWLRGRVQERGGHLSRFYEGARLQAGSKSDSVEVFLLVEVPWRYHYTGSESRRDWTLAYHPDKVVPVIAEGITSASRLVVVEIVRPYAMGHMKKKSDTRQAPVDAPSEWRTVLEVRRDGL